MRNGDQKLCGRCDNDTTPCDRDPTEHSYYLYHYHYYYLLDDVSCIRCMTTYYCEGDGEQKMCGRCDNDTVPCDRDPTEHSFGNSSECSSCLEGWVR